MVVRLLPPSVTTSRPINERDRPDCKENDAHRVDAEATGSPETANSKIAPTTTSTTPEPNKPVLAVRFMVLSSLPPRSSLMMILPAWILAETPSLGFDGTGACLGQPRAGILSQDDATARLDDGRDREMVTILLDVGFFGVVLVMVWLAWAEEQWLARDDAKRARLERQGWRELAEATDSAEPEPSTSSDGWNRAA
jgi:hypothetical protein